MSTVADKLAKKSSSKTSAKQVRLRLVYVDFWSAVKLSFLAAVALAIVTVVAEAICAAAEESVRLSRDVTAWPESQVDALNAHLSAKADRTKTGTSLPACWT